MGWYCVSGFVASGVGFVFGALLFASIGGCFVLLPIVRFLGSCGFVSCGFGLPWVLLAVFLVLWFGNFGLRFTLVFAIISDCVAVSCV